MLTLGSYSLSEMAQLWVKAVQQPDSELLVHDGATVLSKVYELVIHPWSQEFPQVSKEIEGVLLQCCDIWQRTEMGRLPLLYGYKSVSWSHRCHVHFQRNLQCPCYCLEGCYTTAQDKWEAENRESWASGPVRVSISRRIHMISNFHSLMVYNISQGMVFLYSEIQDNLWASRVVQRPQSHKGAWWIYCGVSRKCQCL